MPSLKDIIWFANPRYEILKEYMESNPEAFKTLGLVDINRLDDELIEIGVSKGLFDLKKLISNLIEPRVLIHHLKPSLLRLIIDQGIMVNDILMNASDNSVIRQAAMSPHLDLDRAMKELSGMDHFRKLLITSRPDVLKKAFNGVNLDSAEDVASVEPYYVAGLIFCADDSKISGKNRFGFLTKEFVESADDVILLELAHRGVFLDEAFDNGSSDVRVAVIRQADPEDIKAMVKRNGDFPSQGQEVKIALAERGLFLLSLAFDRNSKVSAAAISHMNPEDIQFDYQDIKSNITQEQIDALVKKGLFLKDILMDTYVDDAGFELVDKIISHPNFQKVSISDADIECLPSEFLVKILSARPELSEKLINHSSSLVRLEALKHVKNNPDMDWVANMFSCLRDDEPTLIHKLKTILIERGMCLDIFIFDGDKSIAWFAAQEILNNDYEIDYSMVDAAIKVYSQSSMPSDIEMCDILKRIMQTQENRNYPDSLEP